MRAPEAGAVKLNVSRPIDLGPGPSGGRNGLTRPPGDEVQMPKPGEARPIPYDETKHIIDSAVSMDVFESGNGQIHVKGHTAGQGQEEALYTFHEPGADNPWTVEQMPEGYTGPPIQARTPGELVRKVAAALGVSGRLSVMDEERPKAKGNSAVLYTAKPLPGAGARAAAPPATPAPTGLREPFTPSVASGGARPPRIEGEGDMEYQVRTAPSDFAAEGLLKGSSLAALRGMAAAAGIPLRSGATKAQIIEAFLQRRRRWQDSEALSKLDTPRDRSNDRVMDTPTLVNGIIDPFPRQETTTLIGIANRVTPQRERDNWVATMNGRTWRIRDGYAEAYDGTRDANGKPVVVERMPVDDLRAMLIEHLENYGIDNYKINYMRS